MKSEKATLRRCQYCDALITRGRVCAYCTSKRKLIREIRRMLAPTYISKNKRLPPDYDKLAMEEDER